MSGSGHPLPASREARHKEIPEHLEREKGRGDDSTEVVQPQDEAVNPGGEPYHYDDLGRGPETVGGQNQQFPQGQQEKAAARTREDGRSRGEHLDEVQGGGRGDETGDDFASDQAEHQDRGQSVAEAESGDR